MGALPMTLTVAGHNTRFRVDNNPKVGRLAAVDIPILQFVLCQLDQRKGQWPRVARESGVPYRTLQKIAMREVKDPGVITVQKLADYFRSEAAA